jgi:hypothetical protein
MTDARIKQALKSLRSSSSAHNKVAALKIVDAALKDTNDSPSTEAAAAIAQAASDPTAFNAAARRLVSQVAI